MNWQRTGDVQGSETVLCVIKVGTCHCMFIQTHGMYKAKSGH